MFKIHGHKHAFEASTLTERDGWFVAVEEVAGEKAIVPTEEAPKVEETPKVEGEAAAAAAAPSEEKKEEKAEEKVVEPIYSGVLGYKAPGLKK